MLGTTCSTKTCATLRTCLNSQIVQNMSLDRRIANLEIILLTYKCRKAWGIMIVSRYSDIHVA